MPDTRNSHSRLFLDVFIVAVAVVLIFLASHFGLETGRPATRGIGTVLGGFYIVYLGVLFLLSYFFSKGCNIFRFLNHVCTACSQPASRHMALFYFVLSLVFGSYLLLIGFGVL